MNILFKSKQKVREEALAKSADNLADQAVSLKDMIAATTEDNIVDDYEKKMLNDKISELEAQVETLKTTVEAKSDKLERVLEIISKYIFPLVNGLGKLSSRSDIKEENK